MAAFILQTSSSSLAVEGKDAVFFDYPRGATDRETGFTTARRDYSICEVCPAVGNSFVWATQFRPRR